MLFNLPTAFLLIVEAQQNNFQSMQDGAEHSKDVSRRSIELILFYVVFFFWGGGAEVFPPNQRDLNIQFILVYGNRYINEVCLTSIKLTNCNTLKSER